MKRLFHLIAGKLFPRAIDLSAQAALLPAHKLLNDHLHQIKRTSHQPSPEILFPQLVRQIQESFRCSYVNIVLSDSQHLEGYYGAGNLVKEVVESPLVIASLRELLAGKGKGSVPYVVEHREGRYQVTSFPLYYEKNIIGAITFFESPRSVAAPEWMEVQSSFAHLVSLMLHAAFSSSALESTKKKLQESQQDLATIHRISMTINSKAPMEELMEQIIREAAICLTPAANQGAIFRVNPRKKGFTLVSQFGSQKERSSKSFFNFDEAFSLYQAYLDHRTITVNDLEKEKMMDSLTELFQPRSFILAPLIIQDKAVGVMFLGDTQVPHKFSLGEVSRVVTISHQLSTAIYLESLQNKPAPKKRESKGKAD